MKRILLVIVLATAAVAAVSATGGAQQAAPEDFTVVSRERETRFKVIDVPPRGAERRPNLGDGFVIAAPLRRLSGQRAGRLAVVATVVRLRRRGRLDSTVRATIRVGAGDITVEGLIDDRGSRDNRDILAITGGTGRYTGAQGTMTVSDTRTTTRLRLDFTE